MPWHTPERKTEQALKLYFQAVTGWELDGVQIATRFSNAALTEPRIEIVAESCQPWEGDVQYYTGNWSVNVKISVHTHYEKNVDAEAHDNLVGSLLDVLLVGDGASDKLVEEINKTQVDSDFTAQLIDIGARSNMVEDHTMKTEQELVVMMSPSKL